MNLIAVKSIQSTSAPKAAPKKRWSLYTIVPLGVLVIFLGLVCVLGIQQLGARSRANGEILRLTSAGFPVDNASLAEWFLKNSSPEMTAKWNDILIAIAATSTEDLPIIGSGKLPTGLRAGTKWDQEQQVAEFLKESQPLYDQIQSASKGKTPVWMPIAFNGYSTLLGHLQTSRSVTQFLQLECEHAIYHQDAPRVMRSLETMQRSAEAFNWDFCAVCTLINAASRQVYFQSIARSLDAKIWNDEQLEKLAAQVRVVPDYVGLWKKNVIGDRAMLIAELENPGRARFTSDQLTLATFLYQVPSVRENLLSEFRGMEMMPSVEISKLEGIAIARNAQSQGTRNSFSMEKFIYHLVMPNWESYSALFAQHEQHRRLCITGIAIKRFHLKHNRWPKELSELAEFDLNSNDWSTVNQGPFGYTVESDRAIAWGRDQKMAFDLDSPPAYSSDEPGLPDSVVSIR